MAIAVRGASHTICGVVFETYRGSTYAANALTQLCRHTEIRQSMGQVESRFDDVTPQPQWPAPAG